MLFTTAYCDPQFLRFRHLAQVWLKIGCSSETKNHYFALFTIDLYFLMLCQRMNFSLKKCWDLRFSGGIYRLFSGILLLDWAKYSEMPRLAPAGPTPFILLGTNNQPCQETHIFRSWEWFTMRGIKAGRTTLLMKDSIPCRDNVCIRFFRNFN